MDVNDIPLPVKNQGFSCCVVAPRGSGKSTVTGKLLDVYISKKIFQQKNIHIFCPSLDLNDDYERFEHVNKYSKVNGADILQLIREARYIQQNYGKERMPRILIVLDDCLSEKGIMSNRNNPLTELFVLGRHLQISVILLSQQLKRIEKTLRENTGYWILFQPFSIAEMEAFLNDFVTRSQRTAFLDRFIEVWDEPYQFVFMDNLTKNRQRKFRIGFSKPMFQNLKRKREPVDEASDEEIQLENQNPELNSEN